MDRKLMLIAAVFLVILIVVVILVVFIFLAPIGAILAWFFIQAPMKTEQCNIQTGFMCNDPVPQIFSVATGADAGTVQMNLRLYNKQSQPIKVFRVTCTSGTRLMQI